MLPRFGRDADEDVRLAAAAQPVVELGDDAAAEQRAEGPKGAGLLGNRDAEERFARFAKLGALGHEPQPIEIHVRAAQHRDQLLIGRAGARRPGAQARDRERAGRLHQRARVVEHVLDRRADLVVGDAHDFIDERLHDREGEGADLAHGDAVGEDADAIERDPAAGFERSIHRVGLERLDADDFDRRA